VELPTESIFFGTQYHPEFTLLVAAGLIEMRAANLVRKGSAAIVPSWLLWPALDLMLP